MSNTEHPPDRWSQSLESATPPVALPDAFVLSVGMNIEIISRAHSLLKIRHLIFVSFGTDFSSNRLCMPERAANRTAGTATLHSSVDQPSAGAD